MNLPVVPPARHVTTVVWLSILLMFFTVPHVLEDFMLGEPLKRGVAPTAIALVVASLLALQGAALHWLGQARHRGLIVSGLLGVLWAMAAGVAQMGEILVAPGAYRHGAASVAFVVGTIIVGITLATASAVPLVRDRMHRRH